MKELIERLRMGHPLEDECNEIADALERLIAERDEALQLTGWRELATEHRDEVTRLQSQVKLLRDSLSRATLAIALMGGKTNEFHEALAATEPKEFKK